ncbi:MAG: efflux RND transporter periplasmic adaptor subunit [Dehalococcoidales bacterium]
MRRWRIIGILLLGLVLAGATACNPFAGDEEEISQQLVEVVRGDLTVTVSGSGNIEAFHEAWLTFSSGGRIDKIYVKEGDEVSKDEVLATLDTYSLEVARTQAQVSLTQAQLALTQAQVAQQTAEYELDSTLDKKDALELALLNAQIDVKTAKHHLDETRDIYTWPEIEVAQDEVDEAKAFLQYVIDRGLPAETVAYAQARVEAAEAKLDAMITSYDTEEVAIAKLQVEAAEMALTQAQKNLDELAEEVVIKELQVEVAKESVEQARQSVELAQQSLEEAQKQLDEATLIAPFDGVVASVYVKEGDVIPTPTMAPKPVIHLIDPTSMELIVEVDEIDMPEVRLDQEAIIEVDALPDTEFRGRISAIYPLPITEGGVVLYNVKINLDVPENSALKIGMSASADIIIDQRSNVLLVPNRAIEEDSQGNPVVKVMVNGQIEERPVVIGISNGLETEIVSGLSRGEIVVVEIRVKPKEPGIGFL